MTYGEMGILALGGTIPTEWLNNPDAVNRLLGMNVEDVQYLAMQGVLNDQYLFNQDGNVPDQGTQNQGGGASADNPFVVDINDLKNEPSPISAPDSAPPAVDAENPPVFQPPTIPTPPVDVSAGGGGSNLPLEIGGGAGILAAVLASLGGGGGAAGGAAPAAAQAQIPAGTTPATTPPATPTQTAPSTAGDNSQLGALDTPPVIPPAAVDVTAPAATSTLPTIPEVAGLPAAADVLAAAQPTGAIPATNPDLLSGDIPKPAAGRSALLGILGKIFGVDTSKGDASILDSLMKLGLPLTSAILNGNAATNAANVQAAASDKAAQLAADAAKNSLDFEKQVYNDQQTQTAPYRTAGTNALDKIQTYLGIGGPTAADGTPRLDPSAELTTTPRYKLDFGEGIKAMNAANRGIVSGATIKAAERFGQGLADKTFDSNFNNLSTVAGLGQTGTSQSINSGTNAVNATTGINTNMATGVGGALQNAAAARASAYGSGIGSQILDQIQEQQILKQLGLS